MENINILTIMFYLSRLLQDKKLSRMIYGANVMLIVRACLMECTSRVTRVTSIFLKNPAAVFYFNMFSKTVILVSKILILFLLKFVIFCIRIVFKINISQSRPFTVTVNKDEEGRLFNSRS